MKQRISVEQLTQLTADQKDRLREWWKPDECNLITLEFPLTASPQTTVITDVSTGYDGIQYWHIGRGFTAEKELKLRTLPLLSIGQCIQLLRDIGELDIAIRGMGTIDFYFKRPMMGLVGERELIDALWQAVKEVL